MWDCVHLSGFLCCRFTLTFTARTALLDAPHVVLEYAKQEA